MLALIRVLENADADIRFSRFTETSTKVVAEILFIQCSDEKASEAMVSESPGLGAANGVWNLTLFLIFFDW